MWESQTGVTSLVLVGVLTGAAVALVRATGWLAGLVIVIKGAGPRDRPAILRAYARCPPWRAKSILDRRECDPERAARG